MTEPDTRVPVVRLLVRSMDRDTLSEQLATLAAQSYPAVEVVVVNASGHPHSALPALSVAVRLIEPGRPLSRAEAANRALDEAGDELAMFVDDDDLLEPPHVARLADALSCTPSAPAAYAGVSLEAEHGRVLQRLDTPWSRGKLFIRNFLPIHAVLFRTSVVRRLSARFDESLAQLEDWDFWLQLAREGDFVHVPGVSARYLLYHGTSGLSAERDARAFASARRVVYRKWLPYADHEVLAAALGPFSDALEEHEAAVGQLRAEVQENEQGWQQQNEALKQQNEALQKEIAALIASRSMRLTAPLRRLRQHRDGLELHLMRAREAWRAWRLKRERQRSLPAARPEQEAPLLGTVDIIVPVYKGLEETRACLESVWASRPLTPYRLIVINDASPEPEVTTWLREAARTRPMMLLENPENLGFVGTVNRGMKLSRTADVVLLNSDTEVSGDWLDRLVRAAYSPGAQPVSSVTPFSNNATICSYPRFCEDNALPLGYDLARLDRLFAEYNAGQSVEIPTAIGFCMYIRRESLTDVGFFDEDNFGKGYGEENDFCMRALKAGWRHLHALDTFVWHKGSVSFGASQPERVTRALAVLDHLHPDYHRRVHRFIEEDPARAARMAIDIARVRERPRPCVLLITHQRGGGTERHCQELIQRFADIDWLMLRPAMSGHVNLSGARSDTSLTLDYHLVNDWEALVEMLKALGVVRLHWHHWLGFDPIIHTLGQALDVPQDVTLHDFYSVCPQISMTLDDDRYCGEKGPAQCHACLKQHPAPEGLSIEQWRQRHRQWLAGCERILTPSHDAAQRVSRYFLEGGEQAIARIQATPHPDPGLHPPSPRWTPPREDEPLRVAVLGALSAIKGADLLEEVASAALDRDAKMDFRLFGFGYRGFAPLANLTVTGAYAENDLPAMLAEWNPHIIWFPAQWPETYSYTLSTALQGGYPVVATNLGALPERLAGRAYSWVLDSRTSVEDWVNWLERLRREVPECLPGSVSDEIPPALEDDFYVTCYKAPIVQVSGALPAVPPGWQRHVVHAGGSMEQRHRLVMALYWLRARPWLRGIAQRIPTTVQRRVKSRLLGEP